MRSVKWAITGCLAGAGFFIGDGAGVGKGRQIAGIIMDNFARGRRQAVWLSTSSVCMGLFHMDCWQLCSAPACHHPALYTSCHSLQGFLLCFLASARECVLAKFTI